MGELGFTRSKDPVTGRFLPGNKAGQKHGVEVFLQTGKLPTVRGKRLLNRWLRQLEKDLREALGGSPTPQEEVLIRQVLRAEGVLRLIEIWLQKVPAISGKGWKRGSLELQPCLSQSYGFFLNVQRQAILALGLKERGEEEPSLAAYVKATYGPDAQASGAADSSGPAEKTPQESTSSEKTGNVDKAEE